MTTMLIDAILSLLLVLTSASQETRECPKPCICLFAARNVRCQRRKLPFIPSGIPNDVEELYLNKNHFENPVLQRSNFSAFTLVRELYLTECGIERIRQDTFTDLRRLRLLDLTDNRIREINDYAFRGLTLNHLFLSSNLGMHISTYAFYGLVTEGLHLQGCGLKRLHIDVIRPLNRTLKTLILDNNEIETFSIDWLYTFKSLTHLRIGQNPFHCNCELRWLHDLFTERRDSIFTKSSLPSCRSPPRLRSKYFSDLDGDDFACDLPVITNVDVDVGLDAGSLFCQARGEPTPHIIWVRPNGKFRVFLPPKNETIKHNEGLLYIRKTSGENREMYVCVAKNPGGNVTMNLKVTWPPISIVERLYEPTAPVTSPKPSPTIKITTVPTTSTSGSSSTPPTPYRQAESVTDSVKRVQHQIVIARNSPGKESSYGLDSALIRDRQTIISMVSANDPNHHGESHFTLVQLVSSVIGTFILTLLLCAVICHLYYRRQARSLFGDEPSREKTPDNVYVTSDMDEQTLKMMTNNQHNQMRELTG